MYFSLVQHLCVSFLTGVSFFSPSFSINTPHILWRVVYLEIFVFQHIFFLWRHKDNKAFFSQLCWNIQLVKTNNSGVVINFKNQKNWNKLWPVHTKKKLSKPSGNCWSDHDGNDTQNVFFLCWIHIFFYIALIFAQRSGFFIGWDCCLSAYHCWKIINSVKTLWIC